MFYTIKSFNIQLLKFNYIVFHNQMIAVLFPGQGSQYVGMGSDFYKEFDSTKETFDIVDKTLGFSLSNIILNGPESELKLTILSSPECLSKLELLPTLNNK